MEGWKSDRGCRDGDSRMEGWVHEWMRDRGMDEALAISLYAVSK